jgi:hypothetical protein
MDRHLDVRSSRRLKLHFSPNDLPVTPHGGQAPPGERRQQWPATVPRRLNVVLDMALQVDFIECGPRAYCTWIKHPLAADRRNFSAENSFCLSEGYTRFPQRASDCPKFIPLLLPVNEEIRKKNPSFLANWLGHTYGTAAPPDVRLKDRGFITCLAA